jgi:hypothetical protein
MASTLDPDSFSENGKPVSKGHDIRTLGPSDSSDSGSDMVGPATQDDEAIDTDTDRFGTGEHSAAEKSNAEVDADIRIDRIVTAEEAGLGDGLDQAEEAQLGITDEELARDPDDEALPDPSRRGRRGPDH